MRRLTALLLLPVLALSLGCMDKGDDDDDDDDDEEVEADTDDETIPDTDGETDTDTDTDTDSDSDTETDTDTETDSGSDTDTDTDTDTDDCEPIITGGDDSAAQYQLTLQGSDPESATGGGSVLFTIRMTNTGESDSNYPELRAFTDTAGASVSPEVETWFGIFEGDYQEAWVTWSLPESASGARAEVYFEAARLGCSGADCPDPNRLTISYCVD